MHKIPLGTTREEYLEFVKHLCAAPKKSSIPSMSILKQLKHRAKAKSRRARVVSSDIQGDTTKLIDRSLEKSTFSLQNGQPVGTISFADPKSKEDALVRHRKDNSIWSQWIVTDDFGRITILYQCPNVEEVNVEYVIP